MADIKLKDAAGTEVAYSGIKHLKVPAAADGGTVEFDLEAAVQEKTVTLTRNGLAVITPDSGYDGLSKVTANINVQPILEGAAATITQNGKTTITPSEGFDGMGSVQITVNVPTATQTPTEAKVVTLDMTDGDQVVEPTGGYTISKVTVKKPDTLLPENIKKDVEIGGVTGTLEATGDGTGIPDLSEWGDAEGDGCVIASPDRLRLQVWSRQHQFSWVDLGYPRCLEQAGSNAAALCAKLDALCAELMTEHKPEFEAVFEGASRAYFMDRLCEIPQITDSDPQSWAGLRQVLCRALPAALNDQWSRDCMAPEDYITAYSAITSSWLSPGDKIHFPFVFRPAVEDGEPVPAAYTLQAPTGSMPEYENGISSCQNTAFFVNAGTAESITAPLAGFVTGIVTALICWYSEGAQTIPEALMKAGFSQDWSYGDVPLGAGWNITGIDAETGALVTRTVTEEAVQTALTARGYYSTEEIPYGEMDSYQQSFFQSVLIQQYKPLGKRSFTIEFDLYGEQ